MKVRRELLPIVISLIFLILAREIYPYAGVMVAEIHDDRYEQISLLIAEATVEYAPKDFICKVLIQTSDSIDNPSRKFVKRIKQLKELNSCSDE